jgi:DNA topoisomerase-2
VMMQKTVIDDLISKNEIIKRFKLTSTLNTSNMHVFDQDCKIRKMSCPEEIIYRFYRVRKEHFIKRKNYLLKSLKESLDLIESKVKFIKYVVNEEIIVFNKKKDFILKQISEKGNLIKIDNSWDYLLDLKIYLLTEEKIKELEDKMNKIKSELVTLKNTSIETMWINELKMI